MTKKKLNLKLEGKNGNAFVLLAHFRNEARRAGWKPEEIKKTLEEATKSDYDHLLQTLINL
jgi:hypothetical protein